MATVNVGMLGHGFMGKAHSNAFRQVRHFFPGKLEPRLRVICGTDPNKLEQAAQQYGWGETETDWRKVVERRDIDIIDICTPNHLHAEQAIAAAGAGKHIICEKPLANSVAEAREALQAVQRAGVKHMLMFNYRRVPAVAYARQFMETGRLGRIHHYRGAYLQDWIVDPEAPLSWRMQKQYAGSGALGDIGSHAVDLALYLNGGIESVTGLLTTFIEKRRSGDGSSDVTVDDDAAFLARFQNGGVGVFEASRFCTGRRNANTFEIYGGNGSLRFDLERLNELEWYDRTGPAQDRGFRTIRVLEKTHPYAGAWWPVGHILGWEHTFIHAVHDFLTCLETDRMPAPGFQDGLEVQAVLEAVQKSARSGAWQNIKQTREAQ
jgi:predicted dehydrogenase